MKTRWVYGILLVVFAVTGIHYNNSQAPNQQIVVQFQDNDISVESTLTQITQKLTNVGVSRISIEEKGTAGYIITYYSTSNVTSVQDILTQDGLITTAIPESSKNSDPEKKDSNVLTVNISEIQNSSNNAWDFEGTLVSQFKEHLDRPITSNTFFALSNIGDDGLKSLNDSQHELNDYNLVVINYASYQIPEVRAGPIC
ncbi:hypothetical protein [Winogradskyella sp. A3E31]|uniref:hypothetical protein n=1 Tax=Winogradskyella sp. A3E31 TaxID=3349637 RepID=UPI00398ABF95